MLQSQLDQDFGFRSGDEDIGCDDKAMPEEFPSTQDIGQRGTLEIVLCALLQGVSLLGCEFVLGMTEQPALGLLEGMFQ